MKGEEGKTAKIVLSRRREIDDIKRKYPNLTQQVHGFERDFRERLRQIGEEVEKIDQEHRELVSTAVERTERVNRNAANHDCAAG